MARKVELICDWCEGVGSFEDEESQNLKEGWIEVLIWHQLHDEELPLDFCTAECLALYFQDE